VWIKLFDSDGFAEQYGASVYAKLCEETNPHAESIIERDIHRTLPEFKLWREDLQSGNNKLFNVLKAFSNFDPEVGYVQGMNYIVGLMLFYIRDEEQVFWCLVSLMHGRSKNWRAVYIDGFPKLQSMSKILEQKIKLNFPDVLAHLDENGL